VHRVVPEAESGRQLERLRSEVGLGRESGRQHSEASLVRRDAAARSSCFRQVEGRPSAALSGSAWWQAPAAA
jgi:hypothetical protein